MTQPSGPEQVGPEQVGPEQTGPEQVGPPASPWAPVDGGRRDASPWAYPPQSPPQYPPGPAPGPWAGRPQPYQQPYRPAPTYNALAIVSFVLGLIGAWPIAVVLGLVALVQMDGRARAGRGLAWAGIALSVAWAAVVIGVAIAYEGHTGPDPTAGAPAQHARSDASNSGADEEPADLDDLTFGACVKELGVTERADLVVVSCGGPHGGRVLFRFDLPRGPWPGRAEVERKAEDRCGEVMDDASIVEPDAELFYRYPSDQEFWDDGDRTVVCLVSTPSWVHGM